MRGECGETDRWTRFFLRVMPLDAGDPPPERRPRGFESFGFRLAERGVRHDGWCMASIPLPDYPVLGLRAGQGEEGLPPVWQADFAPDPEAWRARFEAVAAIEPALRSGFRVHVEGRTLHYAREQCAATDVAARFFLHVTPLDAGDLPEERRAAGFDNLDFAFGDRGLRIGGRCLASVPLPQYGAARVVTGQFEDGARLWEGEFAVGGAAQ